MDISLPLILSLSVFALCEASHGPGCLLVSSLAFVAMDRGLGTRRIALSDDLLGHARFKSGFASA